MAEVSWRAWKSASSRVSQARSTTGTSRPSALDAPGELGRVHVGEVRRRDDQVDARLLAGEAQRLARRRRRR